MKHFTGILFLLLLCFSCTPVHDAPLEQALTLAGDNRKELQQVLGHYEGDSLKHKAACFLIENTITLPKQITDSSFTYPLFASGE